MNAPCLSLQALLAPRHADLAASFSRHWQPGWPHHLIAALRHPVAGPLVRIGARRIARARQQREQGDHHAT